MKYSIPKLYIPKKGNDWYVHFRVEHPETGERVQFKERQDLNRIPDKKERKKCFKLLAARIHKALSEDWSPFEREEEDPDKHNKKDFYWWFERRIAYSKQKHGYYNCRKLETVYKKLKEFAPTLKVVQFNRMFVENFEVHLLKNGDSLNYIADTFTRLKIIVNSIIDSRTFPAYHNPFKGFVPDTTRVEKKRLNEEQINLLAKKKLKDKKQILARDMYLLSFYSAGIRFGDLCRLKPEMFQDGRLVYEMHKTFKKKKTRSILMTEKAKAIYKKYLKNEHLFPLNIDWENEDKSINSVNAYMNKHLKAACKEAEIPEATFHTSRNSFADLSVKHKVGTRQLKELFGHGKEQTTEIYLSDFYPEQTDGAMTTMFGK